MKNQRMKEWSKALLLGMFGFALTFVVVPAAHAKAPYKLTVRKITAPGSAPLGDPASTVTAFGILVHERQLPEKASVLALSTYAPTFYGAEQRKAWIALEEAKTKDLAAKFSASFTETLGKKPLEVAIRKLDPAQSFVPALASDTAFFTANFSIQNAKSADYVKDLIAKAGAEQFVLIESNIIVDPNTFATAGAASITLFFTVYSKDGRALQTVYVDQIAADKKVKSVKNNDPETLALVYDAAVAAIPAVVKKLFPAK